MYNMGIGILEIYNPSISIPEIQDTQFTDVGITSSCYVVCNEQVRLYGN